MKPERKLKNFFQMPDSKFKISCFDGNKIIFSLITKYEFLTKVSVSCCCFILKFGSDLNEVKLKWEILGIFFHLAYFELYFVELFESSCF